MKRRLSSLLLALGLLCSLLPTAFAEGESAVTALCVAATGQSVLLDEAEFELLCRRATGHELESVTFSSLSPAVGKLTLSGEALTPDTVCHTRYKPRLSKVCFTPYARFTGQGEVAFTMTSEREETVSGTLIFYVPEEPSGSAQEPSLMDKTIRAKAGESVDLCDHLPSTAEYTSGHTIYRSEIVSVVFDLPTADQGTLWLDYEYEEIRRKLLPGEVLFPDQAPNYHCLTFVPTGREETEVRLGYTASSKEKKNLKVGLTLNFAENAAPARPTVPADDDHPAARFQDMAGWEWAMPAAEFLGQSGYCFGESTFAPGENATRMDLIHALALTAYSNFRWNEFPDPGFSDQPDDPELFKSVAAIASRGVVQGNGGGLLLPDEPITRQDALVILHRAMADRRKLLPSYGDLSAFSDAGDVAPYAQEAVTLLAARGVVLGDGSGKLDPLSPITRAEMACLLYRAFE